MTFEEFARLTAPRTTPDAPLEQEAGAPLPQRTPRQAEPADPAPKPKRPEPIVRGPRGIGTILPGLGWAFGD